MTPRTLIGIGALSAVAGAVGAGLVLLESPSEARARRLDQRRVADLTGLSRELDVFWTRHGTLPASLDALAAEAGLGRALTDPASGERYGYRAVDDSRYELCATFATAGEPGHRGRFEHFWAHGVGRQCFTAEAARAEPAPRPARGRG
jgi:hypothetical protein